MQIFQLRDVDNLHNNQTLSERGVRMGSSRRQGEPYAHNSLLYHNITLCKFAFVEHSPLEGQQMQGKRPTA